MSNVIEIAKQNVNKKLSEYPKRLKHVYGVAETAVKLAKIYGLDEYKMMVAGLYHDYAKYDSIEMSLLNQEEKDIVSKYPVMFHAYQASYLVQKDLNIKDDDIIGSIKHHVWGKPDMSAYEKILFISDYCEPNRDFLDTDKLYEMATKNLDLTVCRCMEISINDLLNRNLKPSNLQLEAYQYYMEETRE